MTAMMFTFTYCNAAALLSRPFLFYSHRGNLEREMKLLFGPRLRAEGGDGTLNLDT
jgi:hypothetical protein